jgi:hypothetical protein
MTMTTLRQLLLQGMSRPRLEYGGDIGRGQRKLRRPFSSRPMHVVLHSSLARGPWSLRRRDNEAAVTEELEGDRGARG